MSESPPIESLLTHLDALHPSLDLPAFANQLRSAGVKCIRHVALHRAEWLVRYVGMSPQAASLVLAFAMGYMKGRQEERQETSERLRGQRKKGKGVEFVNN